MGSGRRRRARGTLDDELEPRAAYPRSVLADREGQVDGLRPPRAYREARPPARSPFVERLALRRAVLSSRSSVFGSRLADRKLRPASRELRAAHRGFRPATRELRVADRSSRLPFRGARALHRSFCFADLTANLAVRFLLPPPPRATSRGPRRAPPGPLAKTRVPPSSMRGGPLPRRGLRRKGRGPWLEPTRPRRVRSVPAGGSPRYSRYDARTATLHAATASRDVR